MGTDDIRSAPPSQTPFSLSLSLSPLVATSCIHECDLLELHLLRSQAARTSNRPPGLLAEATDPLFPPSIRPSLSCLLFHPSFLLTPPPGPPGPITCRKRVCVRETQRECVCISPLSLLNIAEQKVVILALSPRRKPITSAASAGPQLGCSHTFSGAKAGNDPPITVPQNPVYGSGGFGWRAGVNSESWRQTGQICQTNT